MLARSTLRPVFLSLFGVTALAACGSTPDTGEGTVARSRRLRSPPPCPNCIAPLGPPITLLNPTIDVGSVAEGGRPRRRHEDSQRVRRRPLHRLSSGVHPQRLRRVEGRERGQPAGAEPLFGGTSSTGVPTYTVDVTAGNEVRIDVQFNVSAAEPLGSLSTSIAIWNKLSFAAVKLTSNSTTYPPNKPVFFFTQEDGCAHTGPGGYFQLGDTTSTCPGSATNDAQTGFSVTNRGTGPGTVAFASSNLAVQESEKIQVLCSPTFPSSIAAGATFNTVCDLRAIAPFTAATGVNVPLNLTSNGLRGGQNFSVMVDVVPTSSTSGGGGGGGGGSSSCTQSGNTCTPGASSDGCLTNCATVCNINSSPISATCTPIPGTFCSLPPAGIAGCIAACGSQKVHDCGG